MKFVKRFIPGLLRRALPAGFSSTNTRNLCIGWEGAFQLALRIRPAAARKLMLYRNRRFQEKSCAVIAEFNATEVVFAQQTSAATVFRSLPPHIRKVLNYPIAHHRWLHREMMSEGRRNPKWANFLQGNERTEAELSELDLEIDLADDIFVASSFVKETFLEYGVPASKISVIPLGSDLQLPPTTPDEEARQAKLRVLFVGQMTQRKGIGYLVEAVDAVKGCTLTAVGSSSRPMEEALIAHERIVVQRSMPRNELAAVYANHDVLALPSLAEGFGLVAIEAMRCGTTCIVTDRTFGSDVITDGVDGYIVPAADADSIARILEELIDAPDRAKEMGLSASQTSLNFTWERYRKSASSALIQLLPNDEN